MTETDPLQKEYSKKIEDNGEIMFIGSNNRDNFNEHAETHFTYLIEQGLQPNMVVLDVGCGALRTGSKLVPYLDANNYYGIDRMPELIEFGLNDVLEQDVVFEKNPSFGVNSVFDLNFMDKKADIVWCQSLMSHLDENDIKLCLNNVKNVCKKETKIYFTYFQQDGQDRNINKPSHSKIDIRYDQKVMDSIVHETGLKTIFNGTIGHPRGQWMYICRI
tara:strand:+ start:1337 stop:1990 length:654 start_codon:yes stop_codon:yes gene_type:complete